jgi:DNA-binding transcriptional LysR family regulator
LGGVQVNRMRFHDWTELRHDRSRFLRNLDWNLLKVFVEIVRSEGVTNAAHAMSRRQPSVSSALKRLEDYLGVVLCQRGPSGFGLTDHGKIIANICQQIEGTLEQIPGQFIDLTKLIDVQIRLTSVGNVISPALDDALAAFCRTYPRAEIIISVASWRDIEAGVLSDEADIGIAPVVECDERLNYSLLYREQNVPLCGVNHRLFGTTVENPETLKQEPFVLLGDGEAAPVARFRETHGWGSNCVAQSLDPNEVRRIVLAGTAIAMLPREFLEPDILAGKLWELMPPPPEAQVDICVITAPSNPRHLTVKVFLDILESIQA